MSKRWSVADPKVSKILRERGSLGRGLVDIFSQAEDDSRGIGKVLRGGNRTKNKYNAELIRKDAPENPYGVTFRSRGEFEFRLSLDRLGIKYEAQVDLGISSREFLPGVALKSYKITVDFFLPELNVYLDFKGAITDRAIWQFRLVQDGFIRDYKTKNRPYLCVIGRENATDFLILAKRGKREDLRPFIFDKTKP